MTDGSEREEGISPKLYFKETRMKATRFALGSILFVALFATASIAQNGRTFVSGTGLDTNPCSLTAPCRTFTQAISQTNAGGEVVVLTSAGYGPFSINKAIAVEAPLGVYAGITVTSGDGIDINVGSLDSVILRGLTITNQGSGGNGIVFNSGGTLQVESCIANGFSSVNGAGGAGSSGIEITGSGNIIVKDTVARGNYNGIFVNLTTAASVTLAMDQLHLDGNLIGLAVEANTSGAVVKAAIRNSSASGNTEDVGMFAGAVEGVASLEVESCLVTGNDTGVSAQGLLDGTGTLTISNCTRVNNATNGFDVGLGGVILSRGNNTITGNGSNNGTPTPLPAQ